MSLISFNIINIKSHHRHMEDDSTSLHLSLCLDDSSFEEDIQTCISRRSNSTTDTGEKRTRKRGGGSKKGKAPNKKRNYLLGHELLMRVCLYI